MSRLPDICIVSPLKNLSRDAERVLTKYNRKAKISVLNASLSDTESVTAFLEENTPDIVISRGGMVWLLESKISQPVVEIKTSAYDILDALSPYLGTTKNIGVIGFRSVIDGCMKIARMLNLEITEFIIDEMVEPCIKNAYDIFNDYTDKNTLDIIIGDAIYSSYFKNNTHNFIPFNSGTESIENAINEAIRLYQVLSQGSPKQGFHATYYFHDFITHDCEMLHQIKLAKKYANTEATILLQGENGTGKEILAQGIHHSSPRKNGPFVAVNCGAIPDSIIESELFGYVDGAFSGASKKGRAGLFELAHNGTLFLDEISELDKNLQSKLLRILQERQLMRLGSDRMIPVNVRIIAATNRHLPQMVAAGEFREDLFYRINVLKVNTLPLRDRPQDIRIIGQVTLDSFRHQYHLPALKLSDDLWHKLIHYRWPGNVRQLNNMMERISLSCSAPTLSLSEATLFLDDLQYDNYQSPSQPHCPSCSLFTGSYKQIRSQILKNVVLHQKNNKSRAAKQLKIDRSSLNRWLDEIS